MEQNANGRKKLNEQHAVQIIKEWSVKSVDQFAEEFGVTANTVRAMVYAIRKENQDLCPKKPRKTRTDIAKAAIQMIEEEDRITDL